MKLKDIKLIDVRDRCDKNCNNCPYFILTKINIRVCILDILLCSKLYDENQEIEERKN